MYGNSDFVTVQDGMSVNRPLQRVQCVKLDWTAATSVQSWFSDRRSGSPSYTRWPSGSPGGTRASSATALWTFDRVFPCADAPPPSDHEIVRPSAFAVGPCWSSVTPLWSGICCRCTRVCRVSGSSAVITVIQSFVTSIRARASKPTTLHRDRLTTCAPDANMPKMPERDDRHDSHTAPA